MKKLKNGMVPVKTGRVRENHLVTQSNKLIEAMYRMGLTAKKLMVCMISQVEPDDEDFKYYMIPVNDFKRLAKIKGRTDYFKVLVQAARELRAKDIIIIEQDDRINVGLVSAVKENKKQKMIGIRFDKELKPYLLNIKSEFTRYPIRYVMGMRSVYSIRLYELLKQYEKTNKKERKFSVHDLREKLGVEPHKYKRYFDFKRKVLDVAEREIPEQSDIGFVFEEIKQGRAVKFIKFIITPRKKVFVDDGQGVELDTADIISIEDIPEEILKYIPMNYRTSRDVLRDIVMYLNKHGKSYVLQKVAYTAKMNWTNYSAYLGNVLKKNLGADYDPNQMKLFSDPYEKSKPGMRVEYSGKEYTIDESGCIWPDSGGCMAPGRIDELIKAGEIKLVI